MKMCKLRFFFFNRAAASAYLKKAGETHGTVEIKLSVGKFANHCLSIALIHIRYCILACTEMTKLVYFLLQAMVRVSGKHGAAT